MRTVIKNCHIQFDPPLRDGKTESDRLAEIQRSMRSGQMGGWRPISEAPKDGTAILAYETDQLGGFSVVTWQDGRWLALYEYEQEPTHFMFLPDPPDIES